MKKWPSLWRNALHFSSKRTNCKLLFPPPLLFRSQPRTVHGQLHRGRSGWFARPLKDHYGAGRRSWETLRSNCRGSVLSLNENDGSKIWQESKNATSAPAVWNEQCLYSRREEVKLRETGREAVQLNEAVVARKIAPLSETVALAATRQKADYLDYSKNARSV